jgi:hypothetical protein
MGDFYFFIVDLAKQFNQWITDDGNYSCNENADEDLRKIPGKETNNTNDKYDEKKLVFLVQSAHTSDVVNSNGVDRFRIASRNFHPEYTKILLFSEKRIARQCIV